MPTAIKKQIKENSTDKLENLHSKRKLLFNRPGNMYRGIPKISDHIRKITASGNLPVRDEKLKEPGPEQNSATDQIELIDNEIKRNKSTDKITLCDHTQMIQEFCERFEHVKPKKEKTRWNSDLKGRINR